MNEGRSVFGRLAQRTLQTCVRGIVQAVVAVAGVPLFVASLLSLLIPGRGDRGPAGAEKPAGRAGAGQRAAPLGAGMVAGVDRDAVPAPAG